MMALITVVMPVYNTEAYVSRAIDSVLDQSYQNLELLIIDDASTDGSAAAVRAALAKRTQADRQKVRLIAHAQNSGYGAATNTGLSHAQGQWVWFIDSDDWAEPAMLERLHECARTNDAQVAVSRIRSVDLDSGRCRLVAQWMPPGAVATGTETLRRFTRAELVGFQTNKLLSREVWEGIVSPEGNAYGDVVFMAEVLRRSKRVAFVDLALYNYALRPDSVTGSLRPGIWDLTKVAPHLKPILEEAFTPDEAEQLLRHFTYRQVYWPMVHNAEMAPDFNELATSVLDWVRPRIQWNELLGFGAQGRWPLVASLGLAKGAPKLHRRLLRIYKGGRS
ncbi:glycosyltransferase family 2 protein [Arthrobacter pigmenti]